MISGQERGPELALPKSAWTSPMSAAGALQALKEREEPKGLAGVCTIEQTKDMSDLAAAQGIDKAFVVATKDQRKGSVARMVPAERRSKASFEHMYAGPFSKEMPPLSSERKQINAPGGIEVSLVTLRIYSPRALVDPELWKARVTALREALAGWMPHGITRNTYGWNAMEYVPAR